VSEQKKPDLTGAGIRFYRTTAPTGDTSFT
jgi:hypothetical protein